MDLSELKGWKDLLCFRKTSILVLDEATAAVDLETDDLIQVKENSVWMNLMRQPLSIFLAHISQETIHSDCLSLNLIWQSYMSWSQFMHHPFPIALLQSQATVPTYVMLTIPCESPYLEGKTEEDNNGNVVF